MEIRLHHEDLPDGLTFGDRVAVDTETMGLRVLHDRLCLVQLSAGDGVCHLVKFGPNSPYRAPNLKALLDDRSVAKLFHFARFDVAVLNHYLGADTGPIACTKILSRLVRTYTDRHGLKELCRELLGVDISKQQQSSDWGAEELSEAQAEYAASDVLHLHALHDKLWAMAEREQRRHIAEACFAYLPTRARLDLAGWADSDIFAHS